MAAIARPLRSLVLHLALACAWVGLWHLGRILAQTQHASLWFPPAALSFAMFLTMGPRALVAVVAGAVVTTFHSAALNGDARDPVLVLGSGLAFGAAHAFAYGSGPWVFDHLHGESRLGTPRAAFGFVLTATLSALLAAIGGILSLAATGVPGVRLAKDLVPWMVGDLVAVVTLAPAFIVACDWAARRLGLPTSGWLDAMERLGSSDTPLGLFAVKMAGAIAMAIALIGVGTLPGVLVPVALVVYVLIVPVTWIAHTEGAVRTVVAVAGLSCAVAAATLFGTSEQAFNVQAAMAALAGTALFNLTVPQLYADNTRLRGMVTFDQLTGARTRPVFFEMADREWLRARRGGTSMAVVVIDVDHFKDINDTLGHRVGDRALARIVEILRAELRAGDVIGRIGGEEFAIVLPEADAGEARELAERLRQALDRAEWTAVTSGPPVTASFGVAEIAAADGSIMAALERADRAMYEAKRSGRNCVRVSDPSPAPGTAGEAPDVDREAAG